jgi:hypothetical protein
MATFVDKMRIQLKIDVFDNVYYHANALYHMHLVKYKFHGCNLLLVVAGL